MLGKHDWAGQQFKRYGEFGDIPVKVCAKENLCTDERKIAVGLRSLPLIIKVVPSTAGVIAVHAPGGVKIEMPVSVDMNTVAQLAKALTHER